MTIFLIKGPLFSFQCKKFLEIPNVLKYLYSCYVWTRSDCLFPHSYFTPQSSEPPIWFTLIRCHTLCISLVHSLSSLPPPSLCMIAGVETGVVSKQNQIQLHLITIKALFIPRTTAAPDRRLCVNQSCLSLFKDTCQSVSFYFPVISCANSFTPDPSFCFPD